jgi:hypothetical protein
VDGKEVDLYLLVRMLLDKALAPFVELLLRLAVLLRNSAEPLDKHQHNDGSVRGELQLLKKYLEVEGGRHCRYTYTFENRYAPIFILLLLRLVVWLPSLQEEQTIVCGAGQRHLEIERAQVAWSLVVFGDVCVLRQRLLE